MHSPLFRVPGCIVLFRYVTALFLRSGSKTAPLYTGFAVVLLFRSCLLLWISWEKERLGLEDRYGEPKKLNFVVYLLVFL